MTELQAEAHRSVRRSCRTTEFPTRSPTSLPCTRTPSYVPLLGFAHIRVSRACDCVVVRPCRRLPTASPTWFPTLVPSSAAELRSSVPTLSPTQPVLFLNIDVPLASPVRVDEGEITLVVLSAFVQGKPRARTVMVRCTSSNRTLLHVGCPDRPSPESPDSCEMALALPVGNISLQLVAVDDLDNRGHPALKSASLHCSSGSGEIDVRSMSLAFEIRNVIRPVFGEANFTLAGGNATRQILRNGAGTLEVVTSKSGELVLHSHTAFSSPTFISPSAALLSATTGRRLALHVNDWSSARLSLQLPSFADACGGQSVCVFGLEIRNADPADPDDGLAGIFECPGRLPNGKLAPACFGEIDAVMSPPELPVGAGKTRYHVVRYVERCVSLDDEPYDEPGSPACFGSTESAQRCASGIGDTCQRCPFGAMCPGGNEAQSFPGFYTVAHTAIVLRCPPPSNERCKGWNAQELATRCGEGYAGASGGANTHASQRACGCVTHLAQCRRNVHVLCIWLLPSARPDLCQVPRGVGDVCTRRAVEGGTAIRRICRVIFRNSRRSSCKAGAFGWCR